MTSGLLKRFSLLLVLTGVCTGVFAQGKVSLGIHYQAVARDNFGKELVNTKISVKFSIISGDPLASPVYQELHQDVTTSKFGVFSIVIGHGIPTGNSPGESLSDVQWQSANHYLKVEVKFGNDFMDMGTMQFLAVPYALYAQKSLEPGPEGPKGDQGEKGVPGDPASDDQSLSVVNIDGSDYLAISGGNQVKISSIERDGDPTNEIQDLVINSDKLKITRNPTATEWDLSKYLDDKQQLTFNSTENKLYLTNSTSADLSKLLQTLSFNSTTNRLTISDISTPVDLTPLKNDADSDPTNELQTLDYNGITGALTISSKNTVYLNNSIGFKARKSTSQTGLTIGTTYPFINAEAEFIDGACYDISTGNFIAPASGIYTFFITYKADGSGSARILTLLKNDVVYEILGPDISAGTELVKWVTMKLDDGNVVRLTIFTGMSTFSGTGSFLGYKVN